MKKLITLIFIFSLTYASFAQDEDQQSRTGEFPPAGINLIGHISNEQNKALPVIISGVPAYDWYRGCGPTSLGMVLAYYDTHGYSQLLPGDASTQTTLVNAAIASPAHYSDYSLPLDYSPNLLNDKSELPLGDEHSDNCIADFMLTSQSVVNNYWGWSWTSGICSGFDGYLSAIGIYSGSCQSYSFINFSWNQFMAEVDANRPMMFLVDTDGDNSTDHFITVVGYQSDVGINYYGCYNTWDQNLHWYEYRPMQSGDDWGISRVFTFEMGSVGKDEKYTMNENEMTVYPNPAADYIEISLKSKLSDQSEITLTDLRGRVIRLEKANISESHQETRLKYLLPRNLPSGVYQLQLSSPEAVFHQKVVVGR